MINRKRKGVENEQALVRRLKQAGFKAQRIPMSGQFLRRSAPVEGDVIITIGSQDYIAEVKARKEGFIDYNLIGGADMLIKRTVRPGRTEDWLVTMTLDRFLGLVKFVGAKP